MVDFTKPSKSHLMTYRIGRGEQGVLTYEPYKSYLLPHWRFRTVPIAQESSKTLWGKFLEFYDSQDFVGMDMSRKFIQMGMTRSKRYANHKGGRKYVDGKEKGVQIPKSQGHAGKEEKEEASRIFKEVWERCKQHEGYQELKKEFQKEQKEWIKSEPKEEPKEKLQEERGTLVKAEPSDEVPEEQTDWIKSEPGEDQKEQKKRFKSESRTDT